MKELSKFFNREFSSLLFFKILGGNSKGKREKLFNPFVPNASFLPPENIRTP